MTPEEIMAELEDIINNIKGKSKKDPIIRRLFNMHNMLWPTQKEAGIYCSNCVTRVTNRITEYYYKSNYYKDKKK